MEAKPPPDILTKAGQRKAITAMFTDVWWQGERLDDKGIATALKILDYAAKLEGFGSESTLGATLADPAELAARLEGLEPKLTARLRVGIYE